MGYADDEDWFGEEHLADQRDTAPMTNWRSGYHIRGRKIQSLEKHIAKSKQRIATLESQLAAEKAETARLRKAIVYVIENHRRVEEELNAGNIFSEEMQVATVCRLAGGE